MTNIAFVACFGKNGGANSHDDADVEFSNKDTVVMSQKVPEDIAGDGVDEIEYFVKIKTIDYPLVVSSCKTQYGLSLDFKSKSGDYSLKNLSDKSVVEPKTLEIDGLHLNSNEIYSLIRHMLAQMSKDFELSQTQHIFIELSAFEEEMVEMTKLYEQIYGLKPENITNKRMADIIKKSGLYKKISKILGQYSLKMEQVYVEDIILVSYSDRVWKRLNPPLPFLIDAGVSVKLNRRS